MVGAQLDLFGDRHVQLEQARRALAEGRAADAYRELVRLRSFYPEDAGVVAELELARALGLRLEEIAAAFPGERPRLLVALARAAAPGVRPGLLKRAAAELQASGPTALLDGKPASVLLLEAGDAEAAWTAADDAVRHESRARFVSYLADVEHRLGRTSRARECYRQALALDPYDVDWDEIPDDDVQSLPDIARIELELDDGIAWSAPVGVVLGVLPIGTAPTAAPTGRDHASRASALDQARSFLAALIRVGRERGSQLIEARREMRDLAPQLLAAYLADK